MARKTSTVNTATSKRRALCVGINDYPYDGSDLNGCVNDAKAWAKCLSDNFGFAASDIKMLLDSQATKKNMINALKELLAGAQAGDILVFTNSSHGSYYTEVGGDEDEYDEILCPYDISDNHIVDDELREFFNNLPEGVNMTVILDNCFSGTATRAAVNEIIPGMRTPDDRRIRFLNPALRGLKILNDPLSAKPKKTEKFGQSKMREVLLSGCTDNEYSYDALINGKYHGAMSYYALQAIEEAKNIITYAQLHQRLRNLIRRYPQHPQLEGQTANKKRQIFS